MVYSFQKFEYPLCISLFILPETKAMDDAAIPPKAQHHVLGETQRFPFCSWFVI